MSTPNPHNHDPAGGDRQLAELRDRWIAHYGALVATQLEPDRRYSLLRIGSVEYAFTDHDRYVRALRYVWSARLTHEPLNSAVGSELLEVAPDLQAVDPDLDDLRGPDERSGSRFSKS